ncbi:TonB family protein [Pseudorhodobacter turbinis]|uniref:TonB family protein n=1 Tax=Pseudorhodobacter turbinis TaxID=2500533 RepID=A0A4V1E0I4_9RHOB|nr:energy transducer TonB [Pseudorhodobacter turbinis]QCO54744.1 TonB family protein [Pseudorhodobacter turbinis]
MSGRLQACVAIALAMGLHVGAFALHPAPIGANSSGAGGENLLSLQAANASIAEMVDDWDEPPQAPQIAEVPPQQPVQSIEAPKLPAAPTQAVAPIALPSLSGGLPEAAISLPPPPPPQVIEPEYRPAPTVDVRPPKKTDPQNKAKRQPKKAAKPQKKAAPSAARAAQKASGAGNGAQAGTGGTSTAATLSKATLNNLRASWGASIRARIERRRTYPSAARGASGTVAVRLTVSRSGQLRAVSVAKSSGNKALDQAAIKAVKAARKFPAAPKGLTESQYSFSLSMRFSR